ncbi:hypothetical protein [Bradyrhizobium sp. Ec3.3]|uniref:hypothetical protein n=1 Tax=Bradyrhizobium sp. Ec3.3 TaxID=189753 RepID=UPI00048240C1|nr:hypothetical protein [Bradyrhizobium sp. Ec3.3]
MLGLAILFAAVGLGFAVGYGTREVVSRRRYAEYLAYAPYLGPPRPNVSHARDDSRLGQQPITSLRNIVSMLADRISFALALDFTLALLLILLLPRPL